MGVVGRLLSVIGPDEHSYITDSNTYTNAAAGRVMAFAAEAAQTLGLAPPSLATWKSMADSMLIDTQKFCRPWQNASVDGCPEGEVVTIHPQYDGYHGQDINQADVALLLNMSAEGEARRRKGQARFERAKRTAHHV